MLEWFSIFFVIKYESKQDVNQIIYRDYDDNKSRLTIRELKLRKFFIGIWITVFILFTIEFTISGYKTVLSDMGKYTDNTEER